MSYREVTKDDVGKMVEVRDDEHRQWQLLELEHVMPNHISHRFIVLLHGKRPCDWCLFKEARIRTSPLPDGWLPDDWRVLGDEETCKEGDIIVFEGAPKKEFTTDFMPNPYFHVGRVGFGGKQVSYVISLQPHHLCVIRPRYRPATKDDINKIGIGKHDDTALIKAIVERDNQGYDAWCLHKERGWCVARLSEMKVENEGWNVTN
jgi:hypothetical protein